MSEEVQGFAVIPNWLVRHEGLSPAAKSLYVSLSSRAGAKGVCWPSQGTLARETGFSESTLRRALRVLERAGLVTTTTVTTPTGRHNTYRIHVHLGEGGSGHTDRMGPVTVTGKEEPLEEEPSTHTPPVSPDTRRGKMTPSWNVTAEAGRQARERFPSINHARERDAFRDWHIGQDTAPKTAAQWDALFLGWCARKQTKHEQDNPATSSRVERDPITGMPINPKPMNVVSPGETQREDTP